MFKELFEKLIGQRLADDRGGFRLKRILLTILSAIGSKGVTLLVTIISLPLTYNYLGEERYGMMMTIVSVIAMLGFADLGLGLGLHNRIAKLDANEDKTDLKRAVSSTFFMLLAIAFFLSIIFLIGHNKVEYYQIFNVKDALAKQEASKATGVFFLCFIFSLPFSLIQKMQGGLQEGYYNEMWRTGGNIFGLLMLFVAIHFDAGVHWLILAIYGSNTLFLLFNFAYQFLFVRPYLLPYPKYFHYPTLKLLLGEGLIFFALQFLAVLANASDNLVIARIFGSEEVAYFSVAFRLFVILTTPLTIITSPVLPALNDAVALNDFEWLRKAISRVLKFIIISSIGLGMIYYVFGAFIVKIWVGDIVPIPNFLYFTFAIYVFFYGINHLISTIFTSSFLFKFLIKIYPLAVTVVVASKIFLAQIMGIEGVLWASIIGFSIFYFLPCFYKLHKLKIIKLF